MNNILKAAYGFWSSNRKPIFETFEETMYQMLISGDFVFSGKMLSSNPMDKQRSEQAWRTLLQPFKTSREQINCILFGSKRKEIQSCRTSTPKYNINDFSPSEKDSGLIQFIVQYVINRRHNLVLVGPPGCGKSCLIECLTMKYGVQFFGTPDELKDISSDVKFIVFDDFDFDDFNVDDIKRLLDREFYEQRVSVRYADAILKNSMTRIILCNSLPKHFDDPAVQDRTHIKFVNSNLFSLANKRKFRGTHLLDDEECFDNENDEDELVKEFAWSYGSVSKRAIMHDKEYESDIRSHSNMLESISKDEIDMLQKESRVVE